MYFKYLNVSQPFYTLSLNIDQSKFYKRNKFTTRKYWAVYRFTIHNLDWSSYEKPAYNYIM